MVDGGATGALIAGMDSVATRTTSGKSGWGELILKLIFKKLSNFIISVYNFQIKSIDVSHSASVDFGFKK